MGWEDIRAAVLDRIRAREWPPGALIPGEEQIAADYGVARATVNRAMQALADEGFVERKKRAGTRVAALPTRRARLDIPVLRREVEATGAVYAFRLLARHEAPIPDEAAMRMGLPGGTPGLYLETLHLADGRPQVFETRWLNPAALPPLPDFATVTANEWLVAEVPFVSGDLVFSAGPAGAAAQALAIAQDTPVFVTERVTVGTAGPITLVRQSHVPGYRVVMQL